MYDEGSYLDLCLEEMALGGQSLRSVAALIANASDEQLKDVLRSLAREAREAASTPWRAAIRGGKSALERLAEQFEEEARKAEGPEETPPQRRAEDREEAQQQGGRDGTGGGATREEPPPGLEMVRPTLRAR